MSRSRRSQLHPETVIRTFERLTRSSGLPPIRLHDLRHTAASLALQAGVPLKVVSEQLGHSSLAITADTYTSVLPAVAQAAAEAVAGVVPRAEPQRRSQSVPIEPVPEDKSGLPRTVCKTKPQVRGRADARIRTGNLPITSRLRCRIAPRRRRRDIVGDRPWL